MSNRNAEFESHQHVKRISRRVREIEAVDFFNLLTGPALLEMTDSYLPEHREPLYPPTVTLSMFIRWITEVEATRLLTVLPPHLSDMAEFALATGLRARNVRELVWSQVDLSRRIAWLYADQVKNNTDLTIPLNDTAIEVIRRRLGSHDTHVFSYRGKPLRNINADAWQRACEQAEISDFRWHDLRHTWASWHVQNGTSLQELMELGGWKSCTMVLRYAHLAGDHLRGAAGNIITNSLRCTAQPEERTKEVNR